MRLRLKEVSTDDGARHLVEVLELVARRDGPAVLCGAIAQGPDLTDLTVRVQAYDPF